MSSAVRRDRFDVVVVGSGPAGATYARVVADHAPGASVLVLEAGPVVSRPPGSHVRTIDDPDERFAAQLASQGPNSNPATARAAQAPATGSTRGREVALLARPGTWLLGPDAVQPGEDGLPVAAMSANVGGMGAHWTGACPTPGAGEWIEDVDRSLLTRAFATARSLLRVSTRAFEGAPLGDHVRTLLAKEYDQGRAPDRRVQPMPLAVDLRGGKRYWTGPGAIFADRIQGDDPRIELRAETTVRRVLTERGRVSAVQVHDRREDRVYEIGARFVVVAADPLRSPQLLHASGIRPPALGHYLNDQPQVCATVRLRDRPPGAEAARHTADGSVDILSGVSWVPYDIERFPYHGQIMQMDASPVPVDESFETWSGSVVECGLFAAKDVRYDDRVEFDDDRPDYFGLPSIKIHYSLTDRDRARIDDMVEEVGKMSSVLGDSVNGVGPEVFPNGSSIHYQGTVRLGTHDDGRSVCDPRMRVWGVDGLYVGGNGAIPTPTACNPTLTAVALAAVGGQDLAARV